jgi:hypothetical protein
MTHPMELSDGFASLLAINDGEIERMSWGGVAPLEHTNDAQGATAPEPLSDSAEFDRWFGNAVACQSPPPSETPSYALPVECEFDRWLRNGASLPREEATHPALAAASRAADSVSNGPEANSSRHDLISLANLPGSAVSVLRDKSCEGHVWPGEDSVIGRIDGFFLCHFRWLLYALGLSFAALFVVLCCHQPEKGNRGQAVAAAMPRTASEVAPTAIDRGPLSQDPPFEPLGAPTEEPAAAPPVRVHRAHGMPGPVMKERLTRRTFVPPQAPPSPDTGPHLELPAPPGPLPVRPLVLPWWMVSSPPASVLVPVPARRPRGRLGRVFGAMHGLLPRRGPAPGSAGPR